MKNNSSISRYARIIHINKIFYFEKFLSKVRPSEDVDEIGVFTIVLENISNICATPSGENNTSRLRVRIATGKVWHEIILRQFRILHKWRLVGYKMESAPIQAVIKSYVNYWSPRPRLEAMKQVLRIEQNSNIWIMEDELNTTIYPQKNSRMHYNGKVCRRWWDTFERNMIIFFRTVSMFFFGQLGGSRGTR